MKKIKRRKRKIRLGSGELVQLDDGSWGVLWPLANGKFMIISPEDVPLAREHNWRVDNRGYVRSNIWSKDGWGCLKFHRAVMRRVTGSYWEGETDHLNRNKLDNRRVNLRNVTASQNQHNKGKQANNSSGYLNVTWDKYAGKWNACVGNRGKRLHLGYFTEITTAATAADFGRIHCHGNGPGDINFEHHRSLYVAILAKHPNIFDELKPAQAIRVLLADFEAMTKKKAA